MKSEGLEWLVWLNTLEWTTLRHRKTHQASSITSVRKWQERVTLGKSFVDCIPELNEVGRSGMARLTNINTLSKWTTLRHRKTHQASSITSVRKWQERVTLRGFLYNSHVVSRRKCLPAISTPPQRVCDAELVRKSDTNKPIILLCKLWSC